MKKIILVLTCLASISSQAAVFSGEVTKVLDNDLQIQPDGTTKVLERVWLQSLNEETATEVEKMPVGTHIKAYGPTKELYVPKFEYRRTDGMIYKIERK